MWGDLTSYASGTVAAAELKAVGIGTPGWDALFNSKQGNSSPFLGHAPTAPVAIDASRKNNQSTIINMSAGDLTLARTSSATSWMP